jgi:hypothetical protein
MGQTEVKKLLGETLEQEKETDERLTEVAEHVNTQALSGSEQEEDLEEAQQTTRDGKGSSSSRSKDRKTGSKKAGKQKSRR